MGYSWKSRQATVKQFESQNLLKTLEEMRE